MTLIPLKWVRTIVAVADHLSLVRASERLNISQSSLSRQIADTERSLAHKLFERGWNGTEPTSAGIVAIAYARRMMGRVEQAQRLLSPPPGGKPIDLGRYLSWAMLETVDAVDAAGSASAAAAFAGVSQPTISRTLDQLAKAIGRPVFVRTATGLRRTDDVAVLRRLWEQVQADAAAMADELGALCGEITGRVAVGLLPFSEQDIIVEVFAVLLAQYPHVRLQAVTGNYAALIDGLKRGEIDYIVGPLRGLGASHPLVERPLLNEWMTIVARLGHPLAGGRADLARLAEQPWVVGPLGTPTRQFFENLLLERGITPPAQICEMVTFPLAERMIAAGDAIGLLTYSDRKRASAEERLAIIATDMPATTRHIGVTSRKDQAASIPQRLFLNLIQSHFPAMRDRAEAI